MTTQIPVARRVLGRTKLEISEVGFGAWGIGGGMWAESDDALSLQGLRRALELGVNFFDTAYVYGDGHSERLLRTAFREASGAKAVVASKVPPKNFAWPGAGRVEEAFPAEWIEECTDRSLKNLGVERLDLQQFHVWNDEWLGQPAWERTWKAVESLKARGKIRCWGVSVNSRAPKSVLKLVASGLCDSVQVIYNLFEQEPDEELFPLCREKGVGVIVRVPFDEGGLTGTLTEKTKFPKGDFRASYFGGGILKETVTRAEKLKELLLPAHGTTLAAAALRFCLTPKEVSTVIPGMRRPAHVEANLAAAARGPLPPHVIKGLRGLAWKRLGTSN